MVRAVHRFAGSFDRQRGDCVHDRQNATPYCRQRTFIGLVRSRAHPNCDLRALGQGDLLFEHHDAFFDPTANDHTVIFGWNAP